MATRMCCLRKWNEILFLSAGRISYAPDIPTGITGTPVAIAEAAVPLVNLPSFPFLLLVPSGNMTTYLFCSNIVFTVSNTFLLKL